jgi:hypothetical protein
VVVVLDNGQMQRIYTLLVTDKDVDSRLRKQFHHVSVSTPASQPKGIDTFVVSDLEVDVLVYEKKPDHLGGTLCCSEHDRVNVLVVMVELEVEIERLCRPKVHEQGVIEGLDGLDYALLYVGHRFIQSFCSPQTLALLLFFQGLVDILQLFKLTLELFRIKDWLLLYRHIVASLTAITLG